MTDCFREGFAAGMVSTVAFFTVVHEGAGWALRRMRARHRAEAEKRAREVARWRRENIREPEE